MRWQLEFVVGEAWKSDPTLAIPVAILPREFTPEDASREAPLAVGTDRLTMVWRRTAEQTGLRHEGARLVRDFDDIVAIEWRDFSRSVEPLVAAFSAVEGLASTMQRLIHELPPPADTDDLELARWRGEARSLNARFHPSAMQIAGVAEG